MEDEMMDAVHVDEALRELKPGLLLRLHDRCAWMKVMQISKGCAGLKYCVTTQRTFGLFTFGTTLLPVVPSNNPPNLPENIGCLASVHNVGTFTVDMNVCSERNRELLKFLFRKSWTVHMSVEEPSEVLQVELYRYGNMYIHGLMSPEFVREFLVRCPFATFYVSEVTIQRPASCLSALEWLLEAYTLMVCIHR